MQGSIKTWTVVGALALALVFGGAYAFTSSAPWGRGLEGMMGPGRMGGNMMGGGMMGPGMMGQGQGMEPLQQSGGNGMGQGGMTSGQGMCTGWYPGSVAQDMGEAARAAQLYVAALWGDPDLVVEEVMEFSNQFYVQIKEQSTGIGAMELLVEKSNGMVHPEHGPNMMWNTRYGHMGRGMMGWSGFQTPRAQMPITVEQAEQIAQQHLDAYMPGATVTEEITTFYGYYTIDLERDGQIFGMLSVNGVSGQVWYHRWHGQFIGMREF